MPNVNRNAYWTLKIPCFPPSDWIKLGLSLTVVWFIQLWYYGKQCVSLKEWGRYTHKHTHTHHEISLQDILLGIEGKLETVQSMMESVIKK